MDGCYGFSCQLCTIKSVEQWVPNRWAQKPWLTIKTLVHQGISHPGSPVHKLLSPNMSKCWSESWFAWLSETILMCHSGGRREQLWFRFEATHLQPGLGSYMSQSVYSKRHCWIKCLRWVRPRVHPWSYYLWYCCISSSEGWQTGNTMSKYNQSSRSAGCMGVVMVESSCQMWTFTEVLTQANLTSDSNSTLTLRGEVPEEVENKPVTQGCFFSGCSGSIVDSYKCEVVMEPHYHCVYNLQSHVGHFWFQTSMWVGSGAWPPATRVLLHPYMQHSARTLLKMQHMAFCLVLMLGHMEQSCHRLSGGMLAGCFTRYVPWISLKYWTKSSKIVQTCQTASLLLPVWECTLAPSPLDGSASPLLRTSTASHCSHKRSSLGSLCTMATSKATYLAWAYMK